MQLRRKLFLVLGTLTLVPLLVLQFGVVERNKRSLEERAGREVLAGLDKLAGELDTLINAQKSVVRGLAAVPSVQHFAEVLGEPGDSPRYMNRKEELERFFLNYQAAVPSIQGLRVFDTSGRTLAKVKEGKIIPPVTHDAQGRGIIAHQGERPFFQTVATALRPGDVGMSNFELGQVAPEAEFCPSMVRYLTPLNVEGRLAGYLVVNMWGSRIDEIITSTLGAYDGRVQMAELAPADPDRDGVYLFHSDLNKRFGNQIGIPDRLSADLGKAAWDEIAAGPAEGMLQLGERLVFYRKVQPYQDRANQWLLVVQRDRAEVLAPVMEVSQTIWALLGVAVLLCLLLARWAAVRMARPVQHLAEIITRYADGERVRYRDSRKDEIGQAGRAYNYLIDTLARAEQDRERAEAVACQAAKMATVGELAAGVAHEINNPLNNMTGLSELMEQAVKEGVDPRVLLEDLEVLRQEQRRCADIVQGLLDFGRPRPPTLTRVELPRLVQESIRLLARRARSAGVLLRFAPQGDLPPVEGDPGQLQQVLVNVLLNAIQATPAGGWVEVTLEHVDSQLRCRVEDTGGGIPESQLSRIFEPFYSTKQDRQGTGLGLSVSYSIVQRHGGRMSAEPRTGGGLSVWFALPLAPSGPGQERLPEAVNA